ncbi:VLN2 [Linum grandiflorum]
MSSTGKVLDPAFQGVGQKPGTEIWRIENFQPTAVPKSEHGKFYMGDSYIILQTTQTKGGSYLYDIHFWIGKDTSQDEAGAAAIKTVELDAALGGRAVQHREIQGHESDQFLSFFKPCIIPLEGGVASGFKHAEAEEFETRLYVCKGKRVVRMKQVPFARSSLNHDDVFILDTEKKIYQFNGANSNIQERAKSLEVVQFLKDKYHEGTCDVAIVDDGKLDTESDSGEFWVLFGGFAPIGKKVMTDDDIVTEQTPPKLYSINGGEVTAVEGELSKGMLENNKCYLLDRGNEVFIWVGRTTQVDERKEAGKAAEDFIASENRPKFTRITRVIQGYETHSFKSNFGSWPAGSAAPGAEEGRGKVAALLKQQGMGVKGAGKSVPVTEEVPPLLEGGGKLEVWCINGNAKTPVPKEDIGKFYAGDCYIVLYTYHSGERKEDYYLCCWFGKNSIEADQQMATRLANTMSNSLKGRPVLGRIIQGKEPPQFIAIFQPMLVLKGGLSSGYKKYIEEKELADDTYTADSVALLRVSGTSAHNNKTEQVDAVAASLNSTECFLLQSGSSVFTWHGNQSAFEQQQLAAKVAEFLKPGATLKHAKEGTESSAFWFPLGGKQSYNSKKASPETAREPHLFSVSLNKGKFQVEEVYNFCQDDLLTEDILILDTRAEVFVWVGQSADPKEKQSAFSLGQQYVTMASALEGLSVNVPLYKVTEGNEPSFFTTYFSWDSTKATAQGNSFQKKMSLLFGIGHHEDKSNGNQGGATQRASALAALSSAFNPSSGKSSPRSQDRNSNQGGPTQRASALAALNNAFNSSSPTAKTSPRPSSAGQGTQRAAAVAALSQVLTAEKKITPDGTPSQSPSAEAKFSAEGKIENEVSEPEVSEEAAVEPKEAEDTGSASGSNTGGDSEPKSEFELADSDIGQVIYSYDQLKARSENPVTGIDFKRREAYLSPEEFQTIFGVEKEAFYKLPKWKQDIQKKKVDLF